MKRIQGVLLTGGKSSRMGADKAMLKLNDEYFANRILETLYSVCDEVMVIGPKFHIEGCKVIFHNDIIPEKGPAGAIYTALKHSKKDVLLVLSCDIPLIDKPLLRNLIMTYNGEDALICRYKDRVHPLIGIYNAHCVLTFQDAIKKNNLKLMSIIEQIQYAFFDVQDTWAQQLTNVNTREDYKKIKDEYSN